MSIFSHHYKPSVYSEAKAKALLQVSAKVEAANPLPYISHPECINFQGVSSYSNFSVFLQSKKNKFPNGHALGMPWRKNNWGNT